MNFTRIVYYSNFSEGREVFLDSTPITLPITPLFTGSSYNRYKKCYDEDAIANNNYYSTNEIKCSS